MTSEQIDALSDSIDAFQFAHQYGLDISVLPLSNIVSTVAPVDSAQRGRIRAVLRAAFKISSTWSLLGSDSSISAKLHVLSQVLDEGYEMLAAMGADAEELRALVPRFSRILQGLSERNFAPLVAFCLQEAEKAGVVSGEVASAVAFGSALLDSEDGVDLRNALESLSTGEPTSYEQPRVALFASVGFLGGALRVPNADDEKGGFFAPELSLGLEASYPFAQDREHLLNAFRYVSFGITILDLGAAVSYSGASVDSVPNSDEGRVGWGNVFSPGIAVRLHLVGPLVLGGAVNVQPYARAAVTPEAPADMPDVVPPTEYEERMAVRIGLGLSVHWQIFGVEIAN
ncbi:MAG: hypothetical protein JJ863_17695 [Deltaproteobacteria bacterium]|nr:hypothetical protein [Deltaproteobacteria bacterium]